MYNEKKALRETQTLRAKKFRPAADPFPEVQDHQNLISWRRSLPLPIDPVWWRSMHAISSYRGNRHRPPVANTHTHRQDR